MSWKIIPASKDKAGKQIKRHLRYPVHGPVGAEQVQTCWGKESETEHEQGCRNLICEEAIVWTLSILAKPHLDVHVVHHQGEGGVGGQVGVVGIQVWLSDAAGNKTWPLAKKEILKLLLLNFKIHARGQKNPHFFQNEILKIQLCPQLINNIEIIYFNLKAENYQPGREWRHRFQGGSKADSKIDC
jgi:hypothetical protein